jgi:hypothetical protein
MNEQLSKEKVKELRAMIEKKLHEGQRAVEIGNKTGPKSGKKVVNFRFRLLQSALRNCNISLGFLQRVLDKNYVGHGKLADAFIDLNFKIINLLKQYATLVDCKEKLTPQSEKFLHQVQKDTIEYLNLFQSSPKNGTRGKMITVKSGDIIMEIHQP